MSSKIVHVAVAVIKDPHGQIFISKRSVESHQGGLWEFPGGKVEDNETVLEALKRELIEEIGITLVQASPLIRIHHDYDDKSVLLDVWCVDQFEGEAFGKEGQKTCWIKEEQLALYDFPAANLPIIKAMKLPDKYMVTGKFSSEKELLEKIKAGLNKGIKLIQFRAKNLSDDVYFDYAEKIYTLCNTENAKLLLNQSIDKYITYQADKFSHGLHLNSKEIKYFSPENKNERIFIATSVHNIEELLHAEQLDVDFVVLSPVNKTSSHPNSTPLGWEKFKKLTEKSNVPVYALGGMIEDDLNTAKNYGAQGIAAIGEFWYK